MHRNIIRLAAGLTLFALGLAAGAAHAADRIPYSSTYDTGFGRDGSARKLITTAIDNARLEILVAADAFTNEAIAVALLNASKRGVNVMVIVGGKAGQKYGAAQFLAREGVSVRQDARYAEQRNSFLVIDNDSVLTGALNFTNDKLLENALLIDNAAALAQYYVREWHAMWAESGPLGAARQPR